MNDIYYLVHTTNKDLRKVKELNTALCKDASSGQFPGIFMTLVTKYNINTESYYPGKNVLIFSKELLKQKNYHINIQDANGMLNENITFFPWQLEELISKIKEDPIKYNMNEVVFHDNISMKYCCKILKKSDNLPHKAINNNIKPDINKLPFYCFVNEDRYTGYPKPLESSLYWFKMLAKVAGINKEYKTKKEYIKAIREKSVYLCKNRHLQNMEYLKNYNKPNIFQKLLAFFTK